MFAYTGDSLTVYMTHGNYSLLFAVKSISYSSKLHEESPPSYAYSLLISKTKKTMLVQFLMRMPFHIRLVKILTWKKHWLMLIKLQ